VSREEKDKERAIRQKPEVPDKKTSSPAGGRENVL
jgi:hypothetical protein